MRWEQLPFLVLCGVQAGKTPNRGLTQSLRLRKTEIKSWRAQARSWKSRDWRPNIVPEAVRVKVKSEGESRLEATSPTLEA